MLDAGCGTGRHAEALIRRGHRVDLLDASPRLLELAGRRCVGSTAYLSDLCAPTGAGGFDAITCRGVLNDLVEDDERDAALASFAALLPPGGLLFLDIREADASRQRADGQVRQVDALLETGATLRFTSRPFWRSPCLVVEERYGLISSDGAWSVHDYVFAMRPWECSEIEDRLAARGFTDIQVLPGVGRRTPDRPCVVALREG